MTPLQFTKALGLTETDGIATAWGDSGQAVGRWQVHPCWVWDHCKLPPTLTDTWDSWIEKNIEAFFNAHTFLPPIEIAMFFHLGHRTLPSAKDWDGVYAVRFTKYSATV